MAFCKALPSGKWLVINWRVCQTVICKLVWGEGKSSHSSDLVEIRCGLQIALYMEMRVMDRLQAGHVLWEVWIRIANLILSLIILQEIAVQKNCMSYTIYIYINIYLLYVHMYNINILYLYVCIYIYIRNDFIQLPCGKKGSCRLPGRFPSLCGGRKWQAIGRCRSIG